MASRKLADSDVSCTVVPIKRQPVTYCYTRQVPAFNESYDAMESFRSKRMMRRLDCEEFKPYDIVLVEALIVRWPIEETEAMKQARYVKKSWKKWRAEFRLEAMSLLYRGSDHIGSARAGEDLNL